MQKVHKRGILDYLMKPFAWISRRRDVNVYFVSGMCNRCDVFDGLTLPKGYCKNYIEWYIPQENETLDEYVREMAKGINTSKLFILVGYSFGGIIIQEMNKFLTPQKNIIISSIKSEREIPTIFRLARNIHFAEYLPERIYASTNIITSTFSRFVYRSLGDKAQEYMTFTDPIYLKWAIHQITNWIPAGNIIIKNLYHIHGTKDQIFPLESIENAQAIEGGDHLMIVLKADEINERIKKILED